MIYNVYCLYDSVAESYMLPNFGKNDEQTIRDLIVSIISNKESLVYFKPEDFLLYHVGFYDSDKGEITSQLPRLVGRVNEFLKEFEKDE